MPDTPPPRYRLVQTYRTLWVVLSVTALVTLLLAETSDRPGASDGFWVALPVLAAPLLLMGRLIIEVDAAELRWCFGYVGWPAWRVPLGDVHDVVPTRSPVWAGSGIRRRHADRLYTVTIGGPALGLLLRDGRRVMLGTPEPERLAALVSAGREPTPPPS